jgi:hypothetical protein
MMLVILLWIAFTVSAGTLAMTIWNLRLYRRSSPDAPARGDSVTVCIPARNEQENIEPCVRAVLASDHAALRVLVYDDHSTDETGSIVRRLGKEDPRVVACPVRMLPEGWIGKQHACDQLGRHAQGDWLLFIDADVRLSPDCIRRALDAAADLKADLLSTFPRQITGTLAESLLVPMIHFVLLSYLPFVRMRRSNDPAASAACGQFILVRREAYLAAGGHDRVRDSMHDGVKLPRVLRRAGFHTDLFDGTDVASCRMYTGPVHTWRGFAKNAYEGLGSVWLLLFLTALHLIGHVLPWGVLVYAAASLVGSGEWLWPLPMPIVLALVCVAMHLIQRAVLANRFRQGLTAAMLHPVGIALMTLVQWHSFVLHLLGRRSWRGRDAAVSRLSGVPAEGVRR